MKKILVSLIVILAAVSVKGQETFNVNFDRFASYWEWNSDLPENIKAEVDIWAGTGENIVITPGTKKVALSFITGYYHMTQEELTQYVESKLTSVAWGGVHVYYAAVTNSMAAEIVLEFNYPVLMVHDLTVNFIAENGESRTVTVKGYY